MKKHKLNTPKRKEQFIQLADALEMGFTDYDKVGIDGLLEDFQLFKKSKRFEMNNVLRKQGDWGELDIHVFDFCWTNSNRRNAKVSMQTTFFIKTKQVILPQLMMKPETFFHKIGSYLGMQDIDFEEFPEFSNQYLLQGEDPDLVKGLMDERLLRFFTVEKDWTIEAVGYYLLIYKANKVLSPGKVIDFYRKGMAIHNMFKASQAN